MFCAVCMMFNVADREQKLFDNTEHQNYSSTEITFDEWNKN